MGGKVGIQQPTHVHPFRYVLIRHQTPNIPSTHSLHICIFYIYMTCTDYHFKGNILLHLEYHKDTKKCTCIDDIPKYIRISSSPDMRSFSSTSDSVDDMFLKFHFWLKI